MTSISNNTIAPRRRVQNSLLRMITIPFATLRGRLVVGAVVLWGLLCLIVLAFGWQAGKFLVNETNHQHL